MRMVAEFVLTSTEASGVLRTLEASHRSVSSLGPAKVLLSPIIQRSASSVLNSVVQFGPDRARVAVVTVLSEFVPMIGSDDFRATDSGHRHDVERDKPVTEETSAAGTGRCRLAIAGTEGKEIPEFVMTPAKAIRRGGVIEPTHRTIQALDPAMVLFDPIVEILTGSVLHAVTQYRSDGAWITVVSVRGDPCRGHAGDRSRGAEERLRRRHVTRLAQVNIDQGTGTIDRPIQITPTAMELEVGLIDIPGAPNPAAPAAAKMIDQRRRELRPPFTYRLMAELDPTEEENFRQIAKAQLAAEAPEDHEGDDVGGILGPVQDVATSFIELFGAVAAAEPPIAPSR